MIEPKHYSLERAFETALGCLGWGDPADGLWFIGLEEGESFSIHDEQKFKQEIDLYSCQFVQDSSFCRAHQNPTKRECVSEYVSKISAPLSSKHLETHPNPKWWIYRREVLWLPGSKVANLNLYPLGKKRLAEFPPQYFSRFGFDDVDQYVEIVREVRFPLIERARKELRPQAIVCFGKAGWHDFQNVFSLQLAESISYAAEQDIQVFEKNGVPIILTRHFSNGMNNVTSDSIRKILHSYGVRIP